MLSKILTSSLKNPNGFYNVLNITNNRVNTISRYRLFQRTHFSSFTSISKYSTIKATNKDTTLKVATSENDHLTPEEIQRLNQDPDNFGTLSSQSTLSFQVLPTEDIKNDIQEKDTQATKILTEANSSKSLDYFEHILKDLIQNGKVKEAVEFFSSEMLTKHRIQPPIRIYEWLINECINSNYVKNAFEIYDHMVGRQMKISHRIIGQLVPAFETSSLSMKKLHSITKIISKKELKINEKVYNSLIRIYARSTEWQKALVLAAEMKERGMNYEFETINEMLKICSNDTNDGFIRAIELWHEMQRLKHTPNINTFDALLKVVRKCDLQSVDSLKKLVESIRERSELNSNEIDDGRPNLLKNPPSIGHLYPLEQVKCSEDRLLILGGLTGFLKQFKQYNITPSSNTITALLNVGPNSFEAHQRVISLLNKNGVVPDANIFYVLLTKNSLKQRFKQANEIIGMMYEADFDVDLVSYGLVAMACKTREEAAKLFDQMHFNNIKIDNDILNAMLKNACTLKNNDFIIYILRKMRSEQIEPTKESIQMIDKYNKDLFHSLRGKSKSRDKRFRNECFKFSREYKQWKKHFRKDQPENPVEKISNA